MCINLQVLTANLAVSNEHGRELSVLQMFNIQTETLTRPGQVSATVSVGDLKLLDNVSEPGTSECVLFGSSHNHGRSNSILQPSQSLPSLRRSMTFDTHLPRHLPPHHARSGLPAEDGDVCDLSWHVGAPPNSERKPSTTGTPTFAMTPLSPRSQGLMTVSFSQPPPSSSVSREAEALPPVPGAASISVHVQPLRILHRPKMVDALGAVLGAKQHNTLEELHLICMNSLGSKPIPQELKLSSLKSEPPTLQVSVKLDSVVLCAEGQGYDSPHPGARHSLSRASSSLHHQSSKPLLELQLSNVVLATADAYTPSVVHARAKLLQSLLDAQGQTVQEAAGSGLDAGGAAPPEGAAAATSGTENEDQGSPDGSVAATREEIIKELSELILYEHLQIKVDSVSVLHLMPPKRPGLGFNHDMQPLLPPIHVNATVAANRLSWDVHEPKLKLSLQLEGLGNTVLKASQLASFMRTLDQVAAQPQAAETTVLDKSTTAASDGQQARSASVETSPSGGRQHDLQVLQAQPQIIDLNLSLAPISITFIEDAAQDGTHAHGKDATAVSVSSSGLAASIRLAGPNMKVHATAHSLLLKSILSSTPLPTHASARSILQPWVAIASRVAVDGVEVSVDKSEARINVEGRLHGVSLKGYEGQVSNFIMAASGSSSDKAASITFRFGQSSDAAGESTDLDIGVHKLSIGTGLIASVMGVLNSNQSSDQAGSGSSTADPPTSPTIPQAESPAPKSVLNLAVRLDDISLLAANPVYRQGSDDIVADYIGCQALLALHKLHMDMRIQDGIVQAASAAAADAEAAAGTTPADGSPLLLATLQHLMLLVADSPSCSQLSPVIQIPAATLCEAQQPISHAAPSISEPDQPPELLLDIHSITACATLQQLQMLGGIAGAVIASSPPTPQPSLHGGTNVVPAQPMSATTSMSQPADSAPKPLQPLPPVNLRARLETLSFAVQASPSDEQGMLMLLWQGAALSIKSLNGARAGHDAAEEGRAAPSLHTSLDWDEISLTITKPQAGSGSTEWRAEELTSVAGLGSTLTTPFAMGGSMAHMSELPEITGLHVHSLSVIAALNRHLESQRRRQREGWARGRIQRRLQFEAATQGTSKLLEGNLPTATIDSSMALSNYLSLGTAPNSLFASVGVPSSRLLPSPFATASGLVGSGSLLSAGIPIAAGSKRRSGRQARREQSHGTSPVSTRGAPIAQSPTVSFQCKL